MFLLQIIHIVSTSTNRQGKFQFQCSFQHRQERSHPMLVQVDRIVKSMELYEFQIQVLNVYGRGLSQCHSSVHCIINELGQQRIGWLKIKGCHLTAIGNQMTRNIKSASMPSTPRETTKEEPEGPSTPSAQIQACRKLFPQFFFQMRKPLSSTQEITSVIINSVVIYLRAKPMKNKKRHMINPAFWALLTWAPRFRGPFNKSGTSYVWISPSVTHSKFAGDLKSGSDVTGFPRTVTSMSSFEG